MKAIALQQHTEKRIFWGLVALIVCLVSSYIYFVNRTVFTIVKRQNMEKEISTLNSHIGELESKYISTKNSIDLDLAYSLGYKDVAQTKYVTRSQSTKELSLNTKRIQ